MGRTMKTTTAMRMVWLGRLRMASAPEAPVSRPEEDVVSKAPEPKGTWTQQNFLSHIASDRFRLIGQIFDTYWILEMDDDMYIMDQHAAHEKVLFEEKMRDYRARKISSQLLSPAVTLTLSGREEEILNRHLDAFQRMGFEIEPFGARSYIVSAVPSNLFSLNSAELFQEILSDLSEDYGEKDPEMLLTRVATMSCKAAVKGNTRLSEEEAKALLRKLLTLDNPYACPHGRPTLVKITKQELEKKFKRIV